MKNSIYSDRVFPQLLRFSPPQPPAPRKRSLPSFPHVPKRMAASSPRSPRTCPSRLLPLALASRRHRRRRSCERCRLSSRTSTRRSSLSVSECLQRKLTCVVVCSLSILMSQSLFTGGSASASVSRTPATVNLIRRRWRRLWAASGMMQIMHSPSLCIGLAVQRSLRRTSPWIRSTKTIVRLFAPVLRVALLILPLPLAALETQCPTTGVIDGQHAALAFDRVFKENPVKFAGYEFLDVTIWVECSSEEARHVSVLECPAATFGLRCSVFYNVSF
jgi:hypothetical protein